MRVGFAVGLGVGSGALAATVVVEVVAVVLVVLVSGIVVLVDVAKVEVVIGSSSFGSLVQSLNFFHDMCAAQHVSTA